MTRNELKARFPNASESFLDQNCAGRVFAGDSKSTERNALVDSSPRETPSCTRTQISFRIYATRPADWDGWHIKELQDMLVRACLLDGDEWDKLEGEITSEKVRSKSEERTEIVITYGNAILKN